MAVPFPPRACTSAYTAAPVPLRVRRGARWSRRPPRCTPGPQLIEQRPGRTRRSDPRAPTIQQRPIRDPRVRLCQEDNQFIPARGAEELRLDVVVEQADVPDDSRPNPPPKGGALLCRHCPWHVGKQSNPEDGTGPASATPLFEAHRSGTSGAGQPACGRPESEALEKSQERRLSACRSETIESRSVEEVFANRPTRAEIVLLAERHKHCGAVARASSVRCGALAAALACRKDASGLPHCNSPRRE